MVLCLLPWPIRSHLAFPGEVAFYVATPERDVVIRCNPAKGANVFCLNGSNYEWLCGEVEGVYSAQVSVARKSSGVLFPFRNIYFKTETPWIEGIEDPLTYTRLELLFEVPNESVVTTPESFGEITAWAYRLVRNFVDIYRAITQETDVVTPNEDDIAYIQPWVTNDYTWTRNGPGAVSFSGRNPTFKWRRLEKTGEGKRTVPPEKISELARLLRSGAQLRPSDQFFLDAKEQAHIHGRYEIAIVLAATGFETFLREALRDACKSRSVATLPRAGKDVPYLDAIAAGDTRNDLLRHVEDLSGQSVKGGKPHNDWFQHTHEVRNEILHRGNRRYTDAESNRAFTAAVEFMNLIRRVLNLSP
jgi:hypothetical protein